MRFREFPVGGRFSSCPTLLLSSRGCASRAPAFRGRAARWLPAYRRRPNRRVIAAPKLYFSDAGVVNRLARRACRSVTTTGSPACVRTGSVPSCGADARGSRRSPCRAPRGRRRGRRPERRRASPSEWRVRPARRRERADPRPRPRFACDCGPCAQNGEEPIGGAGSPAGLLSDWASSDAARRAPASLALHSSEASEENSPEFARRQAGESGGGVLREWQGAASAHRRAGIRRPGPRQRSIARSAVTSAAFVARDVARMMRSAGSP